MYYIHVLINKLLKKLCSIFLHQRNAGITYNRILDKWADDTPHYHSSVDLFFIRDVTLIDIYERMKQHNIGVGQEFHKEFFSFLESHPRMYQRFITMSISPQSASIKDVDKIVDEFNKIRSLYTFKQLYDIDPEWHLFFKENTDSSGNVRVGERRLGVDKVYVDDIMVIKTLSRCELISAIKVYTNVLYRILSLELSCHPNQNDKD